MWGKFLLFNLLGLNLKSGGLHFGQVFYHEEIMGWTSGNDGNIECTLIQDGM